MISPVLKPLSTETQQLAQLLGGFTPVSLADLGNAALLDRVDTKYLVPVGALAAILGRLQDEYAVLEVNGARLSEYSTLYYDTADLKMYHAHHNGRTPRSKVRVRSYGGRARYLEVKLKTNKARTRKVRVRLGANTPALEVLRRERRLAGAVLYNASELHEAVTIKYTRVTLVGKGQPERITIDLGLSVSRLGSVRAYPGMAIVEVKQERRWQSSFATAMKELRLRPTSFSKYCIGIATLEPEVKRNMFMRTLRRMEALGAHNDTPE